MQKGIVLIAWFLVTLVDGVWHYQGPYSSEACAHHLKLARPITTIAYCTEVP